MSHPPRFLLVGAAAAFVPAGVGVFVRRRGDCVVLALPSFFWRLGGGGSPAADEPSGAPRSKNY